MNAAAGGAAMSTIGLIEAFRSVGIESSIVCHDAGTDHEKQALYKAVDGRILFRSLYWWNCKIRAPQWKRPLIELLQLWRTGLTRTSTNDVVRFAGQFNPDLIHTNTILTPEGGRAARRLGIPHVWHVRELIGRGHPYRFWKEGPAFGSVLAKYASVVVANSHATATAIRDWLPTSLLRVVPNGIDVERFEPRIPASIDRPIVVAMVANLTSLSKKQDLFLEAAARAVVALPVEFLIYGHLSESAVARAQWQRRVEALYLSDRFRFAGHISEPTEIMRQIDVLVHTADQESFGRVLVEAMAAGVPVIGVRGGGAAEIVINGETGLLAEVDDAVDLARHIEQLVQNGELRHRLGTAGRRRALKEYDVRLTARRMLSVYEEAMKRAD